MMDTLEALEEIDELISSLESQDDVSIDLTEENDNDD